MTHVAEYAASNKNLTLEFLSYSGICCAPSVRQFIVATNTWSSMGPRGLKAAVPSELRSNKARAFTCKPHLTRGMREAAASASQLASLASSLYGSILPLMTGKWGRNEGWPSSSTCLQAKESVPGSKYNSQRTGLCIAPKFQEGSPCRRKRRALALLRLTHSRRLLQGLEWNPTSNECSSGPIQYRISHFQIQDN